MTGKRKIVIGSSLSDDLASVRAAWERAARGEEVSDHTITFENWTALDRAPPRPA